MEQLETGGGWEGRPLELRMSPGLENLSEKQKLMFGKNTYF